MNSKAINTAYKCKGSTKLKYFKSVQRTKDFTDYILKEKKKIEKLIPPSFGYFNFYGIEKKQTRYIANRYKDRY